MFNEKYNNSLWLMLSGEKAGRETIVKIMNMIPRELFPKIEQMIKMYTSVGLCEPVSYNGVLENGRGNFSFNATILDDGQLSLFIRKVPTAENDFIINEYCLEIMPVEISELSDLKYGSSVSVGRVEHLKRKCKDTFNTDEDNCEIQIDFNKKYSCTRNLFGNFVHTITESTVRPIGMYEDYILAFNKRVNLDRVPMKMYPHQFDNDKRVNRLVRGRKKNKHNK